jgi:hypothetical protein
VKDSNGRTENKKFIRGFSVWAGSLMLHLGPADAVAQDRIWFADSDQGGELFGWMRIGPDVSGDGVQDFLLSAALGACTQPNQGWSAVHSVSTGELQRWCGAGQSAFGAPVWVGDVDGLGVRDVAIADPFYYDPITWGPGTGRVQVYSFETQQLIYEIVGTQTNGGFGAPMESIGDVDLDSIDDLLIGVQLQGSNTQGAIFVFSAATGTLIRRHDGGFQHNLGYRIAALGDADGDEVGDYAGSAVKGGQGRVQVFSGRTGAKLLQLDGIAGTPDWFGSSISSGGDLDGDGLDGDGLDDLLLSRYTPLSGKWGNLPDGTVEAWSIKKKSKIWSITGTGGEWFGEYVCGIGDVNGDGFREILVTAGLDDHDGKDIGRVDLISGRSHRALFRFYAGIPNLLSYGDFLTPGSDFNGDGIEDLMIGTPYGGTRQSEGGHAAIYAGNDLFRQADPLAPDTASTVTVDLRGGEPFTLGLIALVAVNGAPVFEPLLLASFDLNGELQLQADTDPSVSGHDFELLGYAVNRAGRGPLMLSSPQTVAVQ